MGLIVQLTKEPAAKINTITALMALRDCTAVFDLIGLRGSNYSMCDYNKDINKCVSVSLSLCPSAALSLCLFVSLPLCFSVPLLFSLYFSPSVSRSLCLSVSLSVSQCLAPSSHFIALLPYANTLLVDGPIVLYALHRFAVLRR